jgi:hypothetical protein
VNNEAVNAVQAHVPRRAPTGSTAAGNLPTNPGAMQRHGYQVDTASATSAWRPVCSATTAAMPAPDLVLAPAASLTLSHAERARERAGACGLLAERGHTRLSSGVSGG